MTGTSDGSVTRARLAGLVERDGHWAALDALLADSLSGSGKVALLTGPVASGKTELLHAFGEACGVLFVKATCSAFERDLPLGVVSQVFHPLDVPEPVGSLLDVAARAADGPSAHQLHALCLALLDLVADRPLVIGIDDVQHADPSSLHWLLYLIRRLGQAKVLLVLTETASPRAAHTELHTELLRHPHHREVRLAPLASVDLLFESGAGEAMALSGGNPLLVRALLDDQRLGRPRDDGALVIGPGYRRALVSCLHRCENPVLAVARALAVTGEQATAESLGRLAGADAETVASALDVMNQAGLLADGWFRDPAARDAVLDDLSTQDRKDMYLGAALLLHDEGAPAIEIAPHLVMADHSGSHWTVPVLEEAAEHALRDEQVDTALRYLELAHRACADVHGRAAIAAKLMRVEWRVNPSAAGRRLGAVVPALRSGQVSDHDAALLVRPMLWNGQVVEATEAMDRVRRASSAGAGLRAMELWLACSHPTLARRNPGPDTVKSRTVSLTSGPMLKAVTALASVLTCGNNAGAATDAEHVLQAARPSDSGWWGPESAVLALQALVYADRLDVAGPWCDRLLDEARAKNLAVAGSFFSCVRAEVSLRRGDLTAAFDHARTALDLMPAGGWGVGVGMPLGILIGAATRMGRHEDAASFLEQPVPEAMFQSRYGLHYLHARGHHYLATSRHFAAVADFLSCGELMTSWGVDQPGVVPWRTSAAEAWLLHGANRDEAKRLINEQLTRLGPGASRTRGVALRLLAAASQPHHRPQLLQDAVVVLEEHGDQYELARALADLSKAHQALREHRRAWTVARRAWHVANLCDAAELREEMLPSRAKADEDAVADEKPVDPIATLTDAERRVAALAAVGYTNREIASKLYITPSTIEQHLTRVYRKLNVKYRKDLPADLHSYLPSTA
ncbi:LuxR family transcriptional regulator [Lentzea sp. NBRC 102530]|uniref:helix-turn-helix transcriptional regulator n=1 Tax=Lentzea sp. NBRC 102530 TaxID=3032201 RepID=UPI0024A3F556|nr:LuxR family transcriptional regulator [Lentzea sp. NBRC 102530]GLY52968.1 transcriptional regulator [Lentzea sp. NBRC 102530]